MKKNVLLVSFDIRRPGEPAASYAVASLKASLLASPAVQAHIEAIESVSIGVPHAACSLDLIHEALHHAGVSGWGAYDTVAVSAYIWSDDWTKTFIAMLRKEGYTGKIVLGGYQISYATLADLVPEYPEADLFLGMYAESSIIEAVRMARPAQPMYLANTDYPVDFDALPPLYASGLMPVRFGQKMVRMETKRGCPMKCTFCQYRDFSTNKVHKINQSRTLDDLTYLSQMNIGKINFTDAIFNTGSNYLGVTQHLKDLNMRSLLSFQIRPEYLNSETGKQFLDLVKDLKVVLEFGFQTSDPVENEAIQRHNHYDKINQAAQLVQERGIPFEISLIYGLPHQTVDSFQKSIDYSLSLNPDRVVAFPLMLYRGTPLYEQKAHYGFKEEVIGEYNVPVVTSSHSFTRDEWEIMHGMAEQLTAGFSLSRII